MYRTCVQITYLRVENSKGAKIAPSDSLGWLMMVWRPTGQTRASHKVCWAGVSVCCVWCVWGQAQTSVVLPSFLPP